MIPLFVVLYLFAGGASDADPVEPIYPRPSGTSDEF